MHLKGEEFLVLANLLDIFKLNMECCVYQMSW